MTKDIPVEKVDREALVQIEEARARSAGIPLKLIKPKLDAILAGDFDKSTDAKGLARHRHTSTLQAQEQIKVLREALAKIGGGMLEERAPHRAGTMARIARQALEATNG